MSVLHQVALTYIKSIGCTLAKTLVAHVGNEEEVFKTPKSRLIKMPGIGEKIAMQVDFDATPVDCIPDPAIGVPVDDVKTPDLADIRLHRQHLVVDRATAAGMAREDDLPHLGDDALEVGVGCP